MLGALENIFDIEFSPDITISNVSLVNIDGGDKLQKEGRALLVNVDELEPEERREILDLPQEQFEEKGRILRQEEEKETAAIEQGYTEDYQEILNYFDGIISERYHAILDTSLHLRGLIKERDLSKEEIINRKRDMAERFGPEAFYLSSLATAGYFDPDGGVRDIYVDMELNEKYDRYNFQNRFEDLVEDKLLCVFIEDEEDVYEATQEVRGRIAKYQEEDPINNWLDIRGIGPSCEEIISSVMENLEEEFIGIDYYDWHDDADNYVVRIRPQSIPPIQS